MNSGLDLLLINPSGREELYQALASDLTAVEPPVWAGLIATYIRRHAWSVEILDSEAEVLNPQAVAREAKKRNPLLTAVVVYGHHPSASTQNMAASSAICTALKQVAPELKVLLVGGHVAALPERTLLEEEADFICDGEGPVTILELLEALGSNQGSSLAKVRGLWYRDRGRVVSNAPGPNVRDLNHEMPGVAWDLLPMEKYRAHNWHCFGTLKRQPYAALYTTLGCPYHCTFCCIQAPFKKGEGEAGLKETINSYRFWSPEGVASQVDLLVTKYGVRNIKIADEMFVLHPKHVGEICDRLIERRYDLNIWAYARIDTVREDMLDKLKRAGFNWLAFGIEAASEKVRADVDKGFDQEKIFEVIQTVKSAGINVIGNYIFGLPEDNWASMQETLDLALVLGSEFANFYVSMAYPGSKLYEQALAEGYRLPEHWQGYSQHGYETLPLGTHYLSPEEVLRFRDDAFHTYFNHPPYLEWIGKKFGPATIEHIRDMTQRRLKRKHAAPMLP